MQEGDKRTIERLAQVLDGVAADLRLYDLWSDQAWVNVNAGGVGVLERAGAELSSLLTRVGAAADQPKKFK